MIEVGTIHRYHGYLESQRSGKAVEVMGTAKGQRGQEIYWVKTVIGGEEFYAYADELRGSDAESQGSV